MSSRTEKRQKFINALVSTGQETVTLDEIKEICANIGIAQPIWFTNDDDNRCIYIQSNLFSFEFIHEVFIFLNSLLK